MSGSSLAVRGASLLILLQVASRGLTFVANQVLVRFLTAQLLGISTQLEVFYLSVLFFARESLRVAIQRQGSDDDARDQNKKKREASDSSSTQAAVNLSYLSILAGILVALLLGWTYLSSVSDLVRSTPYFTTSLYIYALAAIVELLSEPAFVVMQLRLRLGTRAAAESIATFLRCGVTLFSAVVASRRGVECGVLPFALGQLAYGVGLLVVYAVQGQRLAREEGGFSLLPRRLLSPTSTTHTILSLFHRPTLSLAGSMTAQSLVKHILTQGDTLLVSALSTPTAQGVYALANNYGGLAARLLFQPVEESSRNYFSRLLSGGTTSTSTSTSSSNTTPPEKTTSPNPEKPSPALQEAHTSLLTILHLYTLLSLLILTFGPPASIPLLSLVTGPRWSTSGAGATLSAYMFYIPLLATNGILEAFVSSVATSPQLHAQSLWMGVFSVIFGCVGWVCLGGVVDMGARGLVVG